MNFPQLVKFDNDWADEYSEFDYLMGWITLELMVMHELLDKCLPLLFVQMLKEL
jgi:hypothetical protein